MKVTNGKQHDFLKLIEVVNDNFAELQEFSVTIARYMEQVDKDLVVVFNALLVLQKALGVEPLEVPKESIEKSNDKSLQNTIRYI